MAHNILVTGAGGFIGGHLVKSLLERGCDHLCAVDIKPAEQWWQVHDVCNHYEENLQRLDICARHTADTDTVYNLACDMGGMGFIELNKAACMLNVLINTHLLSAAKQAGVSRYFYSSSACVYRRDLQDGSSHRPLSEIDAYPASPEDGYGWEKLFSERMCRHFREDFGMETRVARFHTIYGPNETWEGGREKVPAALCRKVAIAKLTGGKDIEVWGDGKQQRSFLYVDDCVEAVIGLTNSSFSDPVNIGATETVTINGLLEIVEEIAGIPPLKRLYDPSKPQGVRFRTSDNTLISNTIGWKPTTSLRDGMERTYAWIYDQVSKSLSI